jgi:2,3-bisphosphoglycerate-independent phosphoglycerate mutase
LVGSPHEHFSEASAAGLRQLRIAETEKYAHVTYFFNGGEEKPFDLEDRALVPSPREVPTYDLKPEMSAPAVTAEVISRIQSQQYHMIILNFANMDMVGHTGVLEAAVPGMPNGRSLCRRIVAAAKDLAGAFDYRRPRNAEMMRDLNGIPIPPIP